MHKLSFIFLTVLCWLHHSLWFGKNGINDYLSVKNKISTLKTINAKYKARNERLFYEIDDLNKSNDAIEELARTKLGMIKHGESFYRIVNDTHHMSNK
ncbi:MAG: cell division protein FtsB [Arsenophonus sp.]